MLAPAIGAPLASTTVPRSRPSPTARSGPAPARARAATAKAAGRARKIRLMAFIPAFLLVRLGGDDRILVRNAVPAVLADEEEAPGERRPPPAVPGDRHQGVAGAAVLAEGGDGASGPGIAAVDHRSLTLWGVGERDRLGPPEEPAADRRPAGRRRRRRGDPGVRLPGAVEGQAEDLARRRAQGEEVAAPVACQLGRGAAAGRRGVGEPGSQHLPLVVEAPDGV